MAPRQTEPAPGAGSNRPGRDDSPSDNSLRIVALGGGTGLSTLLRGLKRLSEKLGRVNETELDLTAVVTVSDDGGSSGRLRRDFDILAPGDIRNCLVALAEDEALLSQLFRHRFSTGEGLEGHSFGNLFLAALTEITGDFQQAIQLSSEVLAIRGRIYPSTLCNVRLEATLRSGRSMVGETRITGSRDGIREVRLRPQNCEPLPEALAAIAEADVVTLGPGSLYTSVIPNLLVRGMADAVAASPALKVYICNLMWEPGETEGYSAGDHLRSLLEHSRSDLVDCVVVNDRPATAKQLRRYRAQHSFPVEIDREALEATGARLIALDLLAKDEAVRHNSDRIAELLVDLARQRRTQREAPAVLG